MASPYVIDTENVQLSAADITAIQAALDTLDEVLAVNRIGVDRPNIFLAVPDIVAINNLYLAEETPEFLAAPNLDLDAVEVAMLVDDTVFTANEDAYYLP
jgi:hypothetical protein